MVDNMGTQQQNTSVDNSTNNSSSTAAINDKMMANGQVSTSNSGSSHQTRHTVERGASWGFGETKLLLALWSQDMVQRQLTNSKRTKHVWKKIAERIREHGYDRTADQVRTRVFNMIAEYRRIMKNPTPERRKKCIFFDALHKIYQAKDTNSLEHVIMDYYGGAGGTVSGTGVEYEQYYNFDPLDFTNMEETMMVDGVNGGGSGSGSGDNSDGEIGDDRIEMLAHVTPSIYENGNIQDLNDDSYFSINDEPIIQSKRSRYESSNHHSNHPNHHSLLMNDPHLAAAAAGNGAVSSSTPPQTSAQHAPTSSTNAALDGSASALLIDRMFVHLSKETEVMREWVNLERERLAQEMARRKEEKEREERREKTFLEVLTKFQERIFSILEQNQINNNNNHHHHMSNNNNEDNVCQNNTCQRKQQPPPPQKENIIYAANSNE